MPPDNSKPNPSAKVEEATPKVQRYTLLTPAPLNINNGATTVVPGYPHDFTEDHLKHPVIADLVKKKLLVPAEEVRVSAEEQLSVALSNEQSEALRRKIMDDAARISGSGSGTAVTSA